MKTTQFVTLLRTLSKSEQHDFFKYANRHYPGQKAVLAVLTYIYKFSPSFEDTKRLDTATAAENAFIGWEGKGDHVTRFRNALPDLYAWLKEYLIFKNATKAGRAYEMAWNGILKERGLTDEYEESSQELLKDLGQGKTTEDYRHRAVAGLQLYQHFASTDNSPAPALLQQCDHDLTLFYVTTQLKIACEMANLNGRLSVELEKKHLDVVLDLARSPKFGSLPLPSLYLAVFELIGMDKTDRFAKIIQQLEQAALLVSPQELHTILSYLHNYAASKVRSGEEEQLKLVHQLDMFATAQGVFKDSSALSFTQFGNIVTVACKLEDFDWANSFVEEHSQYLPDDVQQNAKHFAKAMIAHGKTDFKESLKQLGHVQFLDFYNTIRAKTLMLRCYYELRGEGVDLEDFCIAFEQYLIRNQGEHKEVVTAMRNTVGIVKKLHLKKTPRSVLLHRIATKKPIYLKEWLMEKAERI